MNHFTQQLIESRLPQIGWLDSGSHGSLDKGACAMEWVSYLAGEPFSDAPTCTCPVLTAFVQSWNDGLPDEERNEILKPLLPRLIGTRNPALEERRGLMAADWLVRTHTPAWLRLAGLTEHANALASLPEITDMAQVLSIRGPLKAARKDADAARDARGLTGTAAWTALAAAREAGGAAAVAAVGAASWTNSWTLAMKVARVASWAAAGAALGPTKKELQASARELLVRMIEVQEAAKR